MTERKMTPRTVRELRELADDIEGGHHDNLRMIVVVLVDKDKPDAEVRVMESVNAE